MIPFPNKYIEKDAFFVISKHIQISHSEIEETDFLKTYLQKELNLILKNTSDKSTNIEFLKSTHLKQDTYSLNIGEHKISISASTYGGFFYAIQSLIQFVQKSEKIKQCLIEDEPRFHWRGMHFDVSRHFFDIDFIKKYIDILAIHKLNIFHWHLTDDNGWRIEIKKYPKLQEISAWRVDNEDQPWRTRDAAKQGEKSTYGGYYTQDEVRDVIQYAKDRNIEIIPEIEMPGHVLEVLAAYPELACFPKEFHVATGSYWPNKDIFCAGKENVFEFLYSVLDEIIALFPSKYIHIGGDEADKQEWEKCPHCKKRMEEENLSSVFELQSWFIRKIETFLKSRNKILIGWDEILEGGLAPDAIVMSWRGVEGGIEAGKKGHQVIMCPQPYCYFDHYQSNPKYEEEAIGGYTPLEKVYDFEPIPQELEHCENLVLGAQANLWTEWVPTEAHAEYMILPRISALAEVVWTKHKSWTRFQENVETLKQYYRTKKWNFCDGTTQVEIISPEPYIYELSNENKHRKIYYKKTTDAEFSEYNSPIKITQNTSIQTGIKDNKINILKSDVRNISIHNVIGKKVMFSTKPSKRYSGTGENTLTNGILATKDFRDKHWLGFNDDKVKFSIQNESPDGKVKVKLNFLCSPNVYIYPPDTVEVNHKTVELTSLNKEVSIKTIEFDLDSKETNLHFTLHQHKILTKNESYEIKPWIFLDQIIVE
jgi:hexosaminidase